MHAYCRVAILRPTLVARDRRLLACSWIGPTAPSHFGSWSDCGLTVNDRHLSLLTHSGHAPSGNSFSGAMTASAFGRIVLTARSSSVVCCTGRSAGAFCAAAYDGAACTS